MAHRAAWQFWVGPIPSGLWVLHKCDNPPCVNPAHLFLGTALDNARDRARKGRSAHPYNPSPGSKNGRARIDEELVVQVLADAEAAMQTPVERHGRICPAMERQRLPRGFRPRTAQRYGITIDQLKHILCPEGWRHVKN